jgi:hypothetical protein
MMMMMMLCHTGSVTLSRQSEVVCCLSHVVGFRGACSGLSEFVCVLAADGRVQSPCSKLLVSVCVISECVWCCSTVDTASGVWFCAALQHLCGVLNSCWCRAHARPAACGIACTCNQCLLVLTVNTASSNTASSTICYQDFWFSEKHCGGCRGCFPASSVREWHCSGCVTCSEEVRITTLHLLRCLMMPACTL